MLYAAGVLVPPPEVGTCVRISLPAATTKYGLPAATTGGYDTRRLLDRSDTKYPDFSLLMGRRNRTTTVCMVIMRITYVCT